MPMNYLEGQSDNIYAAQQLGSTFSNAAVGLALARMRQAQQERQFQMDQAYFGLAQQNAQRQAEMTQSNIAMNKMAMEREQFGLQKERNVQEAAGSYADAVSRRYAPNFNPRPIEVGPQFGPTTAMIGGPSMENARAADIQQMARARAFLSAQSPAQMSLEPQQFTPGAVVYSPSLGGEAPQEQFSVPFRPRPMSAYDTARLEEMRQYHQGVAAVRETPDERLRREIGLKLMGLYAEPWADEERIQAAQQKAFGQEQGQTQTRMLAEPKTQEEYDRLPSGTLYVDTDGKTKRKK